MTYLVWGRRVSAVASNLALPQTTTPPTSWSPSIYIPSEKYPKFQTSCNHRNSLQLANLRAPPEHKANHSQLLWAISKILTRSGEQGRETSQRCSRPPGRTAKYKVLGSPLLSWKSPSSGPGCRPVPVPDPAGSGSRRLPGSGIRPRPCGSLGGQRR